MHCTGEGFCKLREVILGSVTSGRIRPRIINYHVITKGASKRSYARINIAMFLFEMLQDPTICRPRSHA